MQIHLAILDADVPVPAVYAKRGLYSSQFRSLLLAAASRLNAADLVDDPVDIQTTAFDIVGGCFPPFEWLLSSNSSTTSTTPNGNANINGNANANANANTNTNGNGGPRPISAILVTGSAAAAYDKANNPWIQPLQEFLQRVYVDYPAVKILGSCFGHQIIAQALLDPTQQPKQQQQALQKQELQKQTGLKVEACPHGYEIGVLPIALSEEFVCAFPRLARYIESKHDGQGEKQQTLKIQVIHGDRVVSTSDSGSLPSGWINIGHTAISPIHGLFNPHRVLTYQGHFEFDAFVSRETCLAFGRKGKWPAEQIEKFIQLIEEGKEDDSEVAAEVVVLFLADRTT